MDETSLRRRRLLGAALGIPMIQGLPRAVSAQGTLRPLSIIVPYPPGGGGDINGRFYADRMSRQLGEKVVVENRPGANGTLGASHVMSAPPDGRTLLFTYGNLLLNQQFLMKEPGVDPIQDLVPITRMGMQTSLITTRADSPVNNLRDFIALARDAPGKYTYAYYGDLALAALIAGAGLDMVRVPYKGGVPGMMDVAAGRVDIIWSSIIQSIPMLKSGRLKVLAVSGEKRLPEWPDAPLVSEIVSDYRLSDYTVVLAPKGTPREVADSLYEQSATALSTDEARQRLQEMGSVLGLLRPEALLAYMREDYAALAAAAKAAGIQPE
ncbi:tripartite tricarboxylate transporter substrate binding protein [Verticiella sediminum]|uniref:Tripartite tricarboxylate transporter substrate binding protein n=1 Tax=Verticiella sediminum TaxID=1247510 RepID=A0A556ACM8_9BURK|nr:tripartite tricarboxylate transporter substrate binding protein [Verticiella sediminum]TSH90623.1 tripartite tricarboxylate transporter substrate binding protein [Verticiella sediminum]